MDHLKSASGCADPLWPLVRSRGKERQQCSQQNSTRRCRPSLGRIGKGALDVTNAGNGPIGMELAQAFQRFGSEVTVFNRSDGILPKEDPEAARIVEEAIRRDGVTFISDITFKRVESNNGKAPITVVIESDGTERGVEVDALLVATGRKPNVTGLGLEEAGIEFDQRTGVKVNDRLQTTNPHASNRRFDPPTAIGRSCVLKR